MRSAKRSPDAARCSYVALGAASSANSAATNRPFTATNMVQSTRKLTQSMSGSRRRLRVTRANQLVEDVLNGDHTDGMTGGVDDNALVRTLLAQYTHHA